MDLSFILLSLFLVAVISGIAGAFSKTMLHNILRLVSVALAFYIAFTLQTLGVFQGLCDSVIRMINIAEQIPEIAFAEGFVGALLSTVVGTVLIVVVFLLILLIERIIIKIVVSIIQKIKDKRAEADGDEESEDEAGRKKRKKKKKKPAYAEAPLKRVISLCVGAVSGALLFSVLLMPVFYTASLATTVTDSLSESDAVDSKVYQAVEIIDEHIVSPYEESFVVGLYDSLGLTKLMNYTASRGGRIELSDGTACYADDVVKTVLSHGVSAAAQITSLESECKTIKDDINAIIGDPVVSDLLVTVIMEYVPSLEVAAPEENDVMGKLVYDFAEFYKNADRQTIANDLRALAETVGVLCEEKLITELTKEDADIAALLEDSEMLGGVIEAISGLSAFPPIIEEAFLIGVEALGESFQAPKNDAEVYETFVSDLIFAMKKDTDVKFDENTIKYYIYMVATQNKKVSASNGIKGHSTFIAYTKHWAKIQSAFAHASEDKSYGYFTMEINGKLYIYDHINNTIVIYSETDEEIYKNYKNKISPVHGLINALALRSRTTEITRDNLNTILTAYKNSSGDTVSVALCERMLLGEDFVSEAVTLEKMLAACDFSSWSDPEVRRRDARLYVDIIFDLLSVIESLEGVDESLGVNGALELVDQFVTVGEAMDVMDKTACTNKLPELLIEALIKSDLLSDYISPDIAFKNIEIVKNNENQTYANCMRTVAANIRLAISFGGVGK